MKMLCANDDHRAAEWEHVRVQGAPIFAALAGVDVLEVCINAPGSLWIETRSGWSQRQESMCSLAQLTSFVTAVATATRQAVGSTRPLLSATLPGGERLQAVHAPAVEVGTISLTIRKPSASNFSIGQLDDGGLFEGAHISKMGRAPARETKDLATLLKVGTIAEFFREAVRSRMNVLISGATGSGKTTLSKALIREIGSTERVITIEDTPELNVPQANHVSLRYSKDGQGLAKVGAKELLEASLRMRSTTSATSTPDIPVRSQPFTPRVARSRSSN
jgi:type IV secretion system protein VirB11